MSAPGIPHPEDPRLVVVGGIVDGRTSDPHGLRARVEALGQCGLGEFVLDVSGSRFSLLPRSTQLQGKGFGLSAQQRFVEALEGVLACAEPGSVESTLHAKLVYVDEVVETLFICRSGRVEAMSRVREASPEDSPPAAGSRPRALPRRRDMLLATLAVLVVGSVWLWFSGYGELAMSARENPAATSAGPFDSLLLVESDRRWGVYEVRVKRGPGYPQDPAQLAERTASAATLTARAACDAVGAGADIQVELVDAKGQVLESARLPLAPLLSEPTASTAAMVRGRVGAVELRLALGTHGAGPR